MTNKIQIIESNHMDYSSPRVQFMLGLIAVFGCTFLCNQILSPKLLVDAFASASVGMLFYEIGNRYSNRLQATAAIWTSLLWLCLANASPSQDAFISSRTIFAILPVFLFLRFLLLEEKKYLFYFSASLIASALSGLPSLICSLSGTIFAAIFLPPKYFSNPTFTKTNATSNILFALCSALIACYCYEFFKPSPIASLYSSTQNLSELTLVKVGAITLEHSWLIFAILILIRLLAGKIFIAPLIFCTLWGGINLLPHPDNLFLVPISYLIAIASFPVFDVLNKKLAMLLVLSGSVLLSIFCFAKISENLTLPHPILKTDKAHSSAIANSGHDFKICLTPKDLNPRLLSGSNSISDLSNQNWIDQSSHSASWFEKTDSYLNLCAGLPPRHPKGKSQTISVNGYGLEKGAMLELASVKINPQEANNVKITLAFPLPSNTRVNWIWKGSKINEIQFAPLESKNDLVLSVDLENYPQWTNNESIEKIGIHIPYGDSSLAIEKIEL